MPRESAVVAGLLRRLRSVGAFAEKNHGNEFTRIGTPDIYGCLRGRFIAVEAKQPGKHATEIQLHVLAEIRAAGGVAIVAHSVAELDAMLAEEFGIV